VKPGAFLALLPLAVLTGLAAGGASWIFLELLHWATDTQSAHPWLLYLLPFAGAVLAWLYAGYGRAAAGGNNLIIDQIHDPRDSGVPLRMFPLILFSTIVTHLFGGSAGREGSAVQMGGSIAGEIARRFKLSRTAGRIVLMCGVAGGFSSVFGTPLAGTIFAMEMLALGGIRYEALIPCLIAAVAGEWTMEQFDYAHAHYAIVSAIPTLDLGAILQVAAAGVAFGIASAAFSELTAWIEHGSSSLIPNPVWRIFTGGLAVIAVTLLLGTRDYNGLSLGLLADSFSGAHIANFAFAAKLLLTAITLGVGFKGGEVTPSSRSAPRSASPSPDRSISRAISSPRSGSSPSSPRRRTRRSPASRWAPSSSAVRGSSTSGSRSSSPTRSPDIAASTTRSASNRRSTPPRRRPSSAKPSGS
jgi:H+/Cl- antiporter ClcA